MKKPLLVIFSFLCLILGYTYAQKIETGVITEKNIISLTSENSGNQYLKAKTEILSTLSTGMAINVSGLLTKLEVTTGNINTKKEILQNIVNIMVENVTETGGKQNGTIEKNDMDKIIMPNICAITVFYNIPSETCSTGGENTTVEDTIDTIRVIGILIILLLVIGGIWYRTIKRSTKIQEYIVFGGITILMAFICMGFDYSDINFGGIVSFVGWIMGGVALVFVGLVIFFIYKANIIAKAKTLNESIENERKQKIVNMINDSEKYFNNGEYEQALKTCNELILMYEKEVPEYTKDETYKITLNYQKDLEKCISLDKEDLVVNKDDKESFIRIGEKLFSLGKNNEAINTYKEAIELFKDDKRFYAILGEHFITLGKNDEAIEMLNKAIEIDKEFKEAYLNKSVALVSLGKYDEALEVYNIIIEIDKSYTEAYTRAQAILGELGRYQEALNVSNRALENNVHDISVYQNKGVILSRLKRYEEAIETYNKALEMNPLNEDILINKSTSLISSGKYEYALECLNSILTKTNPLCINAYINKGIALKHLEKYDEALKAYEEAIKINKDDTDIYINRAGIYQKLKKYDEALKECEEATKINENCGLGYYGKSCIYSVINKQQEAIENLIKAIQIDAKFKEQAKTDEDFDNIRNLNEFKKIIGK